MRTHLVIGLLLVHLPWGAHAKDEPAAAAADDGRVQQRWDALLSKLGDREIKAVEVLQIPPDATPRGPITPQALEAQYHYKLSLRDVRGGKHEAPLAKALKSASAKPGAAMPDLRWAVIFYAPDGTRLQAVYFDKSGKEGAVGDAPAVFTGDLFAWASGLFDRVGGP